MQTLLTECARAGGRVLLDHFGTGLAATLKENQSSVVTAADLASERVILERLRSRHPSHGTLAEESGYRPGSCDLVWVVDPLDGTSNFAAGLPWFGVLIALLERGEPVLAAMYLPVSDELYLSERGRGVTCNGRAVRMSDATALSTVLCSYAMDVSEDADEVTRQCLGLARVVQQVRNVRATNCCVDLCHTLEGRYGGYVNHCTRIWDIAASCLMFPEAGGVFTDLQGRAFPLDLGPDACLRNYPVLGAGRALHRPLVEALAWS